MKRPAQPKRLFVVVGASGSGKTTLCARIIKKRNKGFQARRCMTTTTRSPRKGEVRNKHYRYMKISSFLRRKDRGEFFETAQPHGHHWYGTGRTELLDALSKKGCVVLSVDMQGLFDLLDLPAGTLGDVEIYSIFVDVPKPWKPVLENRLRRRKGGIKPSELRRRMRTAQWEMARKSSCNSIIVNADGKDGLSRAEKGAITFMRSRLFH